MGNRVFVLFVLTFLAFPSDVRSWGGWFSSSRQSTPPPSGANNKADWGSNGLVAEFSVDGMNDPNAVELIENARRKLGGSNPCWFNAYQNLFSSCSEIFAAEEKRSRLAWLLSDCFQRDSGRDSFPKCDSNSKMVNCLRKLKDDEHRTYLEFYLTTNSICHQLQSKAFKVQVENLVNDLKDSALSTEEKLESIELKSDNLIHNSNQIQESITSIDAETRKVGENLKNMVGDMGIVLDQSKELKEQAHGIATSQVDLVQGQGLLRLKMEENLAKVEESYYNLKENIMVLQLKAADVQKEVNKYGQALASKMHNLQGKADEIAGMTGVTVENQRQLLTTQSQALDGLQSLTSFQSEALQESRVTLQQIVGFAHEKHKELREQQEQLLQAHDQLATNSKSMLEAQEAFESKQASMFSAIDKLFALHKAMLLESRLIKAFIVYSLLIFAMFMFTSTKQTYSVRCRLYISLCIAFAIECGILQLTSTEVEQKTRVRSIVKSLLCTYVVLQLLYSFITYRDYEALNHKMLASLIDKVNNMQQWKKEYYCSDEESIDSEVDWPSWLDTELSEDMSINEDPEYLLPAAHDDPPSQNSIVTSVSRKYNLRRRNY
ncbi:protein GAMETE EXPRESSED 1-like [Silene latifolia]|uniref:protein GAMETE EXPRESSED 1-like n=1 Tax=Silene latifolia TaxID=37657 RepID=UPI003D776E75